MVRAGVVIDHYKVLFTIAVEIGSGHCLGEATRIVINVRLELSICFPKQHTDTAVDVVSGDDVLFAISVEISGRDRNRVNESVGIDSRWKGGVAVTQQHGYSVLKGRTPYTTVEYRDVRLSITIKI